MPQPMVFYTGAVPYASSTKNGTVKTDTTSSNPIVYLKSSVDTLLTGYLLLTGGTLTGDLDIATASTQILKLGGVSVLTRNGTTGAVTLATGAAGITVTPFNETVTFTGGNFSLTFTGNCYIDPGTGADFNVRPVGFGSTAFSVLNSGSVRVLSEILQLGSSNFATTGAIRLKNAAAIVARNQANGADIELIKLDSSNYVNIDSGASGILLGTGMVKFGGTTTAYPALKRSSAALQVRLADDSGYADIAAAGITGTTLTATGAAALSGGGTLSGGEWIVKGTTTTSGYLRFKDSANTTVGYIGWESSSAYIGFWDSAGAFRLGVTTSGGFLGGIWTGRILPRVTTITSSSTPTPDGDASDLFTVTALAAGATFAAPTGTPINGQRITIRIKDNGTARTLAWNAIYRASTNLALPTTTVVNKTMYVGFIYNSTDSKWDLLAVTDGF